MEREVKLEVDEGFEVPSLAGLAGLVVEPLEPRRLDATYFDTADLRLLGEGVTVRRRTGEGTRWTVKVPEPLLDGRAAGEADGRARGAVEAVSRHELEVISDRLDPPDEVVMAVADRLGGEALVAVARLESRRARLALRSGDGASVAELDDDRVEASDPSGARCRFREVEVEFTAEAAPLVVESVVDHLVAAGARRSDGRPKLDRALGLLGRR